MKLPGPAEWLYSVRTFGAAMLALYIGLAAGLDRPYWAMASAYIASQPLSGATRSKAVYRAAGTLLGATAPVLLVPNLVNTPALLSVALAGWCSLCIYVALLDRTPRSYMFTLAGFTAAIIGFPAVDAPDQVFATAVARVEEIAVGIVVASVIASVAFPARVAPVLAARLDSWIANARRWAQEALAGAPEDDATRTSRSRLAGDVAEIDLLISYLAWDPTAEAGVTKTVRALRRRMLMLLPVLSGIAQRVRALRAAGPLPAGLQGLLDEVSAWVQAGRPDPALEARLRTAAAQALEGGASWTAVMTAALVGRLRDLVDLVDDCRALRRGLDGDGRVPDVLAFHRSGAPADVLQRDHGRAAWSAGAAALAILLCCTFWIGSAWPDGAVAAEMAAVGASFFAALDDPVPGIMSFLIWGVVAVVIDALYLFGVLPMATNFPMLMLALAPAFLVYGTLVAKPETNLIGIGLAANGATLLSLQSTYNATFAPFVNSALGLVVGLGTASVVTAVVRSVGADWSARQLLRRGWLDLARAAEQRGQGDRAVFAGLMLDRMGMLAPRLAAAGPGSGLRATDVLGDLRIGLNIVDLRRARHGLPDDARGRIDAALDGLSEHFRGRVRGAGPHPAGALLAALDRALAGVTATGASGRARNALLGLVGIRLSLFPDAPPYDAAAR